MSRQPISIHWQTTAMTSSQQGFRPDVTKSDAPTLGLSLARDVFPNLSWFSVAQPDDVAGVSARILWQELLS